MLIDECRRVVVATSAHWAAEKIGYDSEQFKNMSYEQERQAAKKFNYHQEQFDEAVVMLAREIARERARNQPPAP